MTRGFREMEGVTADVGIEAWGRNLEESFVQTADGLASLLSRIDTLTPEETREIAVQADDLHSLLVKFLNEIIFIADTERFLPFRVDLLKIRKSSLEARVTGCPFDPNRHVRRISVKAATYHGLSIDQNGGTVKVAVIFDV